MSKIGRVICAVFHASLFCKPFSESFIIINPFIESKINSINKQRGLHKILNEIYIFNIAKLAVKSIVNVASVYPKPGLITPLDNSALDGTDYPCFLDGAMSLFQCYVNCASVGVDTESLKPEDALTILSSPSQIGINDVQRATRGKLSLKGYVFALGLLSASAGKLIVQKRILTPSALALTAASYVAGITSRELWSLDPEGRKVFTLGERAYISYGLEGIRGEAEHGFKGMLRAAELFRSLSATQGQLSFRERCIHVLVDVMSVNEDTCLAAYGGITELMRVQEEAKRVLKLGGMLSREGVDAVFEMDRHLRSRGSSPRGSAVIVAGALFVLELLGMRLTRSGYDE